MKTVLSTRYIEYPENVTVEVKARCVTVTGPRGTLKREFKHLNVDMQHMVEERKIRVDLWFGNRKQLACIRTVCSHVDVCAPFDNDTALSRSLLAALHTPSFLQPRPPTPG